MNNTLLHTEALRIGYEAPRQEVIVIADQLNLTLQAGQLVCLIGPNGAGKSTLLRTLAGMQKPLAGRVLLGADELHALNAQEMARRMSVVLTEHPAPGLLTGHQLIALGRHPYTDWLGRLSAEDESHVEEAIHLVGAQSFAERPVAELSDGQRQKIFVARAVAQDTPLMLLDEPTAYLDLPRRVELMRLLKHLAHHTGRAILLSTHDLDLALRSADQMWLMSANNSLQTGIPETLVLSGAFEQVFQGEGVCFDPMSGSFAVGDAGRTPVALHGEGLGAVWTRRALERKGCFPKTDAPLQITVTGERKALRWSYIAPQQSGECDSLEALMTQIEPYLLP